MNIFPKKYHQRLLPETTEIAIKLIKDKFQERLSKSLNLRRVTAPLFVLSNTGINDDLNGIEKPVSFNIPYMNTEAEVVHSLAKWKRLKLALYDVAPGYGIYTDMNAIRANEELDNIHSLYVDQWDWEKVITKNDYNLEYLYNTVSIIYNNILETEYDVYAEFPHITPRLPNKIKFITSEDLLQLYPILDSKEREYEIVKEYGAVFISQIGYKLSNGVKHDNRAPDYDNWKLNGDILVWDNILNIPIELSSMGIRVDSINLYEQLKYSKAKDRLFLDFHQKLMNNELPLTIGGGIGQSRLCMFLLQKAHIGEVQSSIWPVEHINEFKKIGIDFL